jgi:hypothetical protein
MLLCSCRGSVCRAWCGGGRSALHVASELGTRVVQLICIEAMPTSAKRRGIASELQAFSSQKKKAMQTVWSRPTPEVLRHVTRQSYKLSTPCVMSSTAAPLFPTTTTTHLFPVPRRRAVAVSISPLPLHSPSMSVVSCVRHVPRALLMYPPRVSLGGPSFVVPGPITGAMTPIYRVLTTAFSSLQAAPVACGSGWRLQYLKFLFFFGFSWRVVCRIS